MERDKADKYIKEFIDALEPSGPETGALKEEVRLLEDSLESRKRLINELTSHDMDQEGWRSSGSEGVVFRDRLKEQVQHLMLEN